jgi:hypothetical protein
MQYSSEDELRECNARLDVVVALLTERHTMRSLNDEIANADVNLNDHTPFFVCVDGGGVFEGTRHISALLRKTKAMETKAKMSTDLLNECRRLLERKVDLLNIC